RIWRLHQKNNSQNITMIPINSSSRIISHTIRQPSTSQKFKTFSRLDQSNFDDENVIDDSNIQINEFENYNDSINMEETSSHMEITEGLLQEITISNKTLIRRPKKLSTLQLSIDNQSDDNNNSDSSNQSDKNNNSDQDEYDIYEEIDDEPDNEYYERITPSLLLTVNSRLLDILPEPSYNPVQLLYNPPLLTEKHPQTIYPYQPIITRIASILVDESNERLMDSIFKRQIEKGVLENKADVRIGLALNLDWYTPYSRVKRSSTLNTFSTNITSLTQVVNEVKSILTSSDIRNQLETTKNSIDSLKRRFDIFKQNQNEFTT
ncbi:23882_t:CDS:2, partial [Gigaspora rosea]